MRYVIVTVEWLTERGFLIQSHWRKSIDGSKVILHHNLVEPVITENDNIEYYDFDSQALSNILNSSEWLSKEIEE